MISGWPASWSCSSPGRAQPGSRLAERVGPPRPRTAARRKADGRGQRVRPAGPGVPPGEGPAPLAPGRLPAPRGPSASGAPRGRTRPGCWPASCSWPRRRPDRRGPGRRAATGRRAGRVLTTGRPAARYSSVFSGNDARLNRCVGVRRDADVDGGQVGRARRRRGPARCTARSGRAASAANRSGSQRGSHGPTSSSAKPASRPREQDVQVDPLGQLADQADTGRGSPVAAAARPAPRARGPSSRSGSAPGPRRAPTSARPASVRPRRPRRPGAAPAAPGPAAGRPTGPSGRPRRHGRR